MKKITLNIKNTENRIENEPNQKESKQGRKETKDFILAVKKIMGIRKIGS